MAIKINYYFIHFGPNDLQYVIVYDSEMIVDLLNGLLLNKFDYQWLIYQHFTINVLDYINT